eukprot:11552069-Ditylum_brightwellii.AAC.1
MARFNGVDYYQTPNYIKMYVSFYFDKIVDGHGWNTPCSDGKPIVPLHPSAMKELETAVGPETLEEKPNCRKRWDLVAEWHLEN